MKARENPFRAEKVVALPFEWPREFSFYEAKLRAQGGRGLILGPRGFGKTTSLDWLEHYFHATGKDVMRLEFRADSRRLRVPVANSEVLLVDGLEQLSHLDLLRLRLFSHRFEIFIATSHRVGFLPVWLRAQTSPALLFRLCQRLEFPVELELCESLYFKHEGNLRFCLGELYDRCACGEIESQIEALKKTA